MSDDSDDYTSDPYDSDGLLDGNDSDFEEPVIKDKGKGKSQSIEYQALSAVRLQELVDDDIRSVAGITGLESPIASILLQHFGWGREDLIEKYLDSPGRDSVLRSAGEPQNVSIAPLPPSPAVRQKKRARLNTPTEFVCGVCCSEVAPEEIFRLRCTHAFCEPCWQAYVTGKVKDEGQCLLHCMQDGCQTVVDEPSIRKLVDGTVYDRYRELVLQNYVQAHPHLRFCPYPSCTETVSCPGGRGSALLTEVPTVQCGQGHVFCFGCGLDSDHRPLICKFVLIWNKNAREDAGTAQWIKANTRTCPRCRNSIEKNGGCNRIVCRHCMLQFCWLCMQNWNVHGYNNDACNAWKEPEPDAEKTEAKQNLEKWLFYFDRFNNHELSARLDQELVERTEEKMLDVQKSSELSWIEAKFMQQAVDELTKCRATLKWTYAMAYFLEQGNQKQIFEDIQADLEKAVEDLSQLLEEPIEENTVKDLRRRMMDKTVYVKGRHDIVLQDTAEGLAEGRWQWILPLE
ncbi:uncharacterized protein LAESUDRAFT_744539 [Laetiporus sulphureus 93-53]|uniref:RBR-type E3 ubiquitin transferase n=1 Tax=Laetiporus sulphureus 93-53 TaxID=1314785 RepID=A0A165CUT6_9APHY|nr:uncharacterized protein LAESUDRAFT_744539 [Laetiporus sulphureus 93-53]KZT03467.1 hypothetical protein LAESUDRAFT_744539 [Laetiporus sulphureus 93-53]